MKAASPLVGLLAATVLRESSAFSVFTSPQRALTVGNANFLSSNRSSTKFWPEEEFFVGDKKCGVTTQVTADSKKAEMCPPECPFYAQNLIDDHFCSFVCVEAQECAEMNEKRPIADTINGKKICRGPMVEHCNEFNYDGTDTCAKCQTFYALHTDGTCHFSYWFGLITVICLGVCGAIFGAVWVADLSMRPVCNHLELIRAEQTRSRQKLHTPKDHDGSRTLYDIDTNLCKVMVAGPGMVLHFNFQVAIMVWAFLVATLWVILALTIDNALFVIGTRSFGTPRDNCILVAWGYTTQQRLMWTKVLFLIIVYIGSVVCCMLHSVRQLRIFQALDLRAKTMKDFVVFIGGLPELKGSDKEAEDKLTRCISEYCQEEIIGTSICWSWHAYEDDVIQALETDLKDAEKELRAQKRKEKKDKGEEVEEELNAEEEEARVVASYGPIRRFFHNMEKNVVDEDEQDELPDMTEILDKISSTENAFVVFRTEGARDDAVNKFNEQGELKFEGNLLTMRKLTCEPKGVNWINFGRSTKLTRAFRVLQGFGAILLALLFWTVVFYVPYAWSIMSFNYDNGAQPPFIFAMAFTMVVVAGNAIMYEVCARVSDFVGFKYQDDRESCYMILYTIACMFNVILDMVTTYYMAWAMITGQGFRTHQGEKLHTVDDFTDRFETYAMQRILAENTFAYSFPSTFLIPFLIEPFITVYFPLKAGQWLVRTHPTVKGWNAESWLEATPMDMGRYADIILNVLLGILIFYFPGGYTHTLFYAMVGSHMVIYAFDHWRVLRSIPTCMYASMEVDWWSQVMLAPCVSTVLSALVVKANCQGYGYCLKGFFPLISTCVFAWFGHLIFHLLLLRFLVPRFGSPEQDDPQIDKTFKDVSEENPSSWFTTNPVHCLRSKYVHKHTPPCSLWRRGKEHLLNYNPDIHCYFNDDEAEAEDFEKGGGFRDTLQVARKMSSQLSFHSKSKSQEAEAKEKENEADPPVEEDK